MSSELAQAATFLQQGQWQQAQSIYQGILAKEPQQPQAYWGLGKIALATQQYAQAVSLLRHCCSLFGNQAFPLMDLATAFNGLCLEPEGLKVLQHAATVSPDTPQVFYQLGLQQIMLGNLLEAELALRQVLVLKGAGSLVSYALLELARLGSLEYIKQDIGLLQTRVQDKNNVLEQITLHYGLGNRLDQQHDFTSAWRHLRQANDLQLQQCEFNTKELAPFFAHIKETFDDELLWLKRKPAKGEITPIFIVGLPRTGSTLLEQALVKHSAIASAGEVPYLSREVNNYLFNQSGKDFPASSEGLPASTLEVAANIYLQKLSAHSQGASFVIDKLPANFQSIGLMVKLFPQCKIINLQRHLPDVALSIYRNYFAENEPYFCDLAQLQLYHQYYAELMGFWHTRLPGLIYDLSYEALIGDTQSTLKSVLNYCELPWQQSCLQPNAAGDAVRTLSNVQVRQPINSKSVGQWHNYAEHLTPFIPS
jgi:tetratricopeptide (TPR) repeat protein